MNENKSKLDTVKTVVKFVVGSLVEIFIGAATSSVVDHIEGPKVAKLGAKAGGFLVGMMVADQVSDYVCGGIDDISNELDRVKAALDEEE